MSPLRLPERRLLAPAGIVLAATLSALGAPGASPAPRLPAIVFVSRAPGAPGMVPGLGPYRAVATGGRLLIREPSGAIRALADSAFYDVSDPAVSPDGRRVAFAATLHPDSGFRIWRVGIDGAGLRAVTRSDRPQALESAARALGLSRYDDLDPCWIDDRTLCFASTRLPLRNLYDSGPVPNLYRVTDDGSGLARITAERNGGEEPAFDPERGRLIYSRWWFNPWRPGPEGVTRDAAKSQAPDSVNLWQIVSIDSGGVRLAAGAPGRGFRGHSMGQQPCPLPGGALAATFALNLGLSPGPGTPGVHLFAPADRDAERLAGPVLPERPGDPYSAARGLAAPAACAPAALPDGRVILSYDPGARGDYGIAVVRPGESPTMVVDLRGTLELDPAPVFRRRAADHSPMLRGIAPDEEAALLQGESRATFTFESLDVFAGSGLPSKPRPVLRFYEERSGQDGRDTVILLREEPIGPGGEVRVEGLPAWTPMFEQIAFPGGPALMGSHGPAHVAGFNFGPAGSVVRCTGCHAGHSRTVPRATKLPAAAPPSNGLD